MGQDQPPTAKGRSSLLRMRLLLAKKDMDGAVKLANSALEANPHDFITQFNVANELANVPDVKGPALDLAAKVAQEGYESGGPNSKLFIMTLARVKMLQGDKEKAVELQTKALNELPDKTPDATRQRYQAILDAYKAGKLPSRPSAS
jgi:tetratricopeptide (TPR) repeat protein